MRLVTVVGARPQFIKAGPVSRAVAASNGAVSEYLVHTGQHYDHAMSRAFFDELELPEPAENLGIGSGPHGAQTGRMLEALESVFVAQAPDAVLVYGDTNSTLAGALAAVKLHIPVAHVEAGLRSFNRRMPEEINRIVADQVSTWCFCPTETAVANLEREGTAASVHLVGDVMYDAVRHYRHAADDAAILERFGLEAGGYDLLTIHRAENTDSADRLRAVLAVLAARERPTVFPVHPRTRPLLDGWSSGAVRLLEPAPYRTMLALEANAGVILTDSGGMQKEASWLRVPCVTLRPETEWAETLQGGWNRLASFDAAGLREALRALSATPPDPAVASALGGDGHAARRIVEHLGLGSSHA